VPLPDALSPVESLRRFASVDIVVLDLDGTLLGDAGDLPGSAEWERRSHLVNRLRSRGVGLTIATGRAFAGAQRAIQAVNRRRDTPFILYNGSVVATADRQLIAHTSLPPIVTSHLRSALSRVPGIEVLLYSLEIGAGLILEQEVVEYFGGGSVPATEFNGLPVRAGPDGIERPCVAALAWSNDPLAVVRARAALATIDGVSVTASGSKYVEVRPKGSSKAAGLRALIQQLKLEESHVLAVGDNDNDLELLEAAGTSVCVTNASARARSASDYITHHSAREGAIEVLDLVVRAKRLLGRSGARKGVSS
jgi:Cof subfamily protein (haloacid dehalogenase superfamily)